MSEPIWHKPAWITACVALVSAFLTVPQVIGDYMVNQERVDAAKIENGVAKLQQEFVIVQETLAQQGVDRITFLRYLVAMLENKEAKNWAQDEVRRLDTIQAREQDQRQLQEKFKQLQDELKTSSTKINNADKLKGELDQVQSDLINREREIALMRASAGLAVERTPYIGGLWKIGNGNKHWIEQFGKEGRGLKIANNLGTLIATGEFDSSSTFWLAYPGSPLSHGTVSDDGTRITWRRGGFVWSRSPSKSDG